MSINKQNSPDTHKTSTTATGKGELLSQRDFNMSLNFGQGTKINEQDPPLRVPKFASKEQSINTNQTVTIEQIAKYNEESHKHFDEYTRQELLMNNRPNAVQRKKNQSHIKHGNYFVDLNYP